MGCMLHYRVTPTASFKCLQSSFVEQVQLQISKKTLNLQFFEWSLVQQLFWWFWSTILLVVLIWNGCPPKLLQYLPFLCYTHTHEHIHPHRCPSWPPTVVLHSVAFSPCNPTPTHYPASKCQQHTHRQTLPRCIRKTLAVQLVCVIVSQLVCPTIVCLIIHFSVCIDCSDSNMCVYSTCMHKQNEYPAHTILHMCVWYYIACLCWSPHLFLSNENIIMNFSSLFSVWVCCCSGPVYCFLDLEAIFGSSSAVFLKTSKIKKKRFLHFVLISFIFHMLTQQSAALTELCCVYVSLGCSFLLFTLWCLTVFN